ncbi:hypothetical protein [Deinococcus pimensis]|uniref:hypothetical protein n=1 Tax=Deinococcus pimensis TaxID=309888 RepID=UPI00146FC79F|nr:hypothetical protein [Deinococcus pimensis]
MKKSLISSKSLSVLGLTGLLTACGGAGTPSSSPIPTPGADRIAGQVETWPLDAGYIAALTFDGAISDIVDPIDADGSGRVDLRFPARPPATEQSSLLQGCTRVSSGDTPPSTSVAMYSGAMLLGREFDPAGELVETDSTDPNTQILHVHSATAFTSGENLNCSAVHLRTDLNLTAGWNLVGLKSDGSGALTLTSLPSATPKLTFSRYTKGVLPAFDATTVSLMAGNSIDMAVRFLQVGGYTGTVKLGTDVPGLTVEPSTITLTSPAGIRAMSARPSTVQALGMRAASTTATITLRADADAPYVQGKARLIVSDASGELGSNPFDLYLSGKGVQVQIDHDALTIERDHTATLPVRLYTLGGFNGAADVSVTGLPEGVTVAPATVNVQGYGTTTLKFVVGPAATPGVYDVNLIVQAGRQRTVLPIRITIPEPSVQVGTAPMTIYAGETTQLPVTLVPVSGFSGPVEIRLVDLPPGVTAPDVTRVDVDGTVGINVSLTAATSTTLNLSNIKVQVKAAATTVTTPVTLRTVPARFKLTNNGFVGAAVDSSGALWTSGDRTVQKIAPDGTTSSYDLPQFSCGSLNFGQDGFLWTGSLPFTRIDPQTGDTRTYTDPGGLGGCFVAPLVDASGRLWLSTAVTRRVDPVNNTTVDVSLGQANLRTVRGNTAWAMQYDGQLLAVYADTLAITRYTIPGVTNGGGTLSVRDGIVWIARDADLVRFDPASGLSRFLPYRDVTSGATLQVAGTLGVDRTGRHWLVGSDASGSTWMLFDPAAGGIVKVVPAMNSSRVVVTEDGSLWFLVDGYAVLYRP